MRIRAAIEGGPPELEHGIGIAFTDDPAKNERLLTAFLGALRHNAALHNSAVICQCSGYHAANPRPDWQVQAMLHKADESSTR